MQKKGELGAVKRARGACIVHMNLKEILTCNPGLPCRKLLLFS